MSIKLDEKRLDYLRGVVLHGYKTLASEEVINKALKGYREEEKKLSSPLYDFTEAETLYKKQIKDVINRRYL